MDYISSWFYDNNKQSNNKQSEYKQSNNKQSIIKGCMLNQGKKLNSNQTKRADALTTNIKVMNAPFGVYEGFVSSPMTEAKNSSQLSDTTTLSDDFDKKITRYDTEQPIFIDETRNFMKLNDRNKNIKDDPKLYKNGDNIFNDITYEKEGCYKSAGSSGLEYQADMKEVNVNTCKMRASDLAYSGFAMQRGADGSQRCYLTKNIEGGKGGGIATKPMTSFSFKKSSSANMGGVLPNGQVGVYNNTLATDLMTDLTAREGCDISGKEILVNDKTLVATFGLNCNQPQLKVMNSSTWDLIGTDSRTGGRPDASFWGVTPATVGKDTYYPAGHTIYAGDSDRVYYSAPRGSILTVAGDVKDPLAYTPLTGSSGRNSITIKRPVCPEGYVSMGDVVTSNIAPTPKGIKCVPQDCVTVNNKSANTIWRGMGVGTTALYYNQTEPASASNGYNLFKTNSGTPFYSIKESCLRL